MPETKIEPQGVFDTAFKALPSGAATIIAAMLILGGFAYLIIKWKDRWADALEDKIGKDMEKRLHEKDLEMERRLAEKDKDHEVKLKEIEGRMRKLEDDVKILGERMLQARTINFQMVEVVAGLNGIAEKPTLLNLLREQARVL